MINSDMYDCSPTIDRCFSMYFDFGSSLNRRIEVFGHDGVSAYRYSNPFILNFLGLVSMGRDHECVVSDKGSKLYYVLFDGISTVTISNIVTINNISNVKMMRDGSYTLVQRVLSGTDKRVAKFIGTTFIQGDEFVVSSPSFLGTTLGSFSVVEDSQYATISASFKKESSLCFFNHVTMSEVKYAKLSGDQGYFKAILMKGSDANNLWVLIGYAISSSTGKVMLANLKNPQKRCFDNCSRCADANNCSVCQPTL